MIGPDVLVDEPPPAADGTTDATAPRRGTDAASTSTGDAGRHRPDGARRRLQGAVLAAPVAALAIVAWVHRSMFFDGYLYLHVVQNLLAGHGPVFNPGQRIEAFTSPLWLALLSAAGFATPFPLTAIAVDLGIAGTVAGLGMAVTASARLVRRAAPDAFLLPLGALVFVAVPPVWSLASLGLETGLVFCWLGGCLSILVRWAGGSGRDVPRWSLVVLGLGPVVRPELALDTLVFVGAVVVVDAGRRPWPRQVALLAWAFAVPLAYEVFRMGYYGMVVANTAVAKEAGLPRPVQGARYVADFASPYWLVVPAAALLIGAYLPLSAALRGRPVADRTRAALAALPAAAVLNAGYITLMGGDYVHARLLMAPFFAACAPVAVVPLARRYAVSLLVVPWAVVCAVSLRTSDGARGQDSAFIEVVGHGVVGAGAHDWGSPDGRVAWLRSGGLYLQEDPATAPTRVVAVPGTATPVVATYWAGQGPYELGTSVRTLDLLGLADPLDAHLQLARRGAFPGHEKPLPTPWIAALLTAPGSSTTQLAALQGSVPNSFTPLVPPVTGRALAVQTAWARAALACPTIHRIAFGADAPLTFATFLGDLVHSVAQTTVRIPPDPATAYHRFCGPGVPAPVRAAGG